MSDSAILERVYNRAKGEGKTKLGKQATVSLDILLTNCERNRGVLSVFLTLLLKKIIAPEQDIRNHQVQILNGFSARTLDTKVVTPFLKEKNFPYMVSGSGALTRSLEQAVPYNLNYTGQIRPKEVRNAFLNAIDDLQNEHYDAEDALLYMLVGLINHRDRDHNLKLIKPKNKSIATVVENIGRHFAQSGKGGSRLPVLAIYAVYKQMVLEVRKYKNCQLCDLQSHTSADLRSGFLGDIQVNDSAGRAIEAVEVKHGIKLTPKLVNECYDKFKTTPGIRTYYLLSTNERIDRISEISELTVQIYRNHGCQVIVNGIQSTLRYYLRLVSSTDNFLDDYVELVEKDCNYETKILWAEIWNQN